jgi:hypothetical protein
MYYEVRFTRYVDSSAKVKAKDQTRLAKDSQYNVSFAITFGMENHAIDHRSSLNKAS